MLRLILKIWLNAHRICSCVRVCCVTLVTHRYLTFLCSLILDFNKEWICMQLLIKPQTYFTAIPGFLLAYKMKSREVHNQSLGWIERKLKLILAMSSGQGRDNTFISGLQSLQPYLQCIRRIRKLRDTFF